MPFLELWQETLCSSRVEMGKSGNFLSCIKGVKDPFESQREGGISLEMLQGKRDSSLI